MATKSTEMSNSQGAVKSSEPKVSIPKDNSVSNVLDREPHQENCCGNLIAGKTCYGMQNAKTKKQEMQDIAMAERELDRMPGTKRVTVTFEVFYVGLVSNKLQTFDADVDIHFKWAIHNKRQQKLIKILQRHPHLLRLQDVALSSLLDGKFVFNNAHYLGPLQGLQKADSETMKRLNPTLEMESLENYMNQLDQESKRKLEVESEKKSEEFTELKEDLGPTKSETAKTGMKTDLLRTVYDDVCGAYQAKGGELSARLQTEDDYNSWQSNVLWLPKVKIPNVYKWHRCRGRIEFKPPDEKNKKDCPFGEAVFILDVFGTFYEKFELDQFPLDCQDFAVTLWSLRNIDQQIFCRPDNPKDTVCTMYLNKMASMEWDFLAAKPMVEYQIPPNTSNLARKRGSLRKCNTYLRIKAARRPAYYMWRVCLFTFIWSALAVATFWMPLKAYAYDGRPNCVFSLLIASTAYQLTIDNMMPEQPYLTFLDKFNLFSFLIMCCVALESIIVLQFAPDYDNPDEIEDLHEMDKWGSYIVISIWLAGLIQFVALSFHYRMRELLKLNMNYQESRALGIYNESHDIFGKAEDGRWIVRAEDLDRCPTVLPYLWEKKSGACYFVCCRGLLRCFLCKFDCPNPFCCLKSPTHKTIEEAIADEQESFSR